MKKSQVHRKPHRFKRKKVIFGNRYFLFFVFLLVSSGFLFNFLFFSETFQIKEIKISGNEKILTEDLQNLIQNQMAKKILFFSSQSIFLVDIKKIKKNILEKFPSIETVDLKRKLPATLTLKVKEREPVAIFHQNGHYFFIDREGIIFEKALVPTSEMFEIKNLVQEKKNWQLGEQAIEKEKMSQVLKIKSDLENIKILTSKALLVSDKRLNIKTSEGWEIYFNLQEDLDWQLTKLSLVLEKKIPSENRSNLEYVDLRFKNKVYYK